MTASLQTMDSIILRSGAHTMLAGPALDELVDKLVIQASRSKHFVEGELARGSVAQTSDRI